MLKYRFSNTGLNMGRALGLAGGVALVLLQAPLHADNPTQRAAWIKTGSSDGILTFKRDMPGHGVVAFRAEGTIGAPIVRVASVLADDARAPEWIDSLAEARLVRVLPPNEFIEYNHLRTPPLFADRDFVCRGRIEVDRQRQTFVMSLWPTTDPALPVGRYIRGTMSGSWRLQAMDGGRKTYVIAEMTGDPKGAIPKWVVNMFQSEWPHNTLMSLRRQVAKSDVGILPQVSAVFRGEPFALAMRPQKPLLK